MKKIAYLTLILIFLNNCTGYKPIFSSGNLQFEIAEYSINGDKILGNKLYSRLKKISKSEENNQNVRSINLQIKSSTDKKATSKDSAGNILAYRITLITEIKVKDFKVCIHRHKKETGS